MFSIFTNYFNNNSCCFSQTELIIPLIKKTIINTIPNLLLSVYVLLQLNNYGLLFPIGTLYLLRDGFASFKQGDKTKYLLSTMYTYERMLLQLPMQS